MPSQLDLDQGGTFRQTERIYMGPSIGWVQAPNQTVLPVTTGGTTTLLRGMNLVLVNFNGAVTIQLPSSKATPAGPQAIPNQSVIVPVVVLDQGGFAYANPITILPFGTELIDSLASITLGSSFGAYVLRPEIDNGGWTLIQ